MSSKDQLIAKTRELLVDLHQELVRYELVAWTSGNVSQRMKFDDGSPDLFACLLYTSPSPRDRTRSRMPSSA